MVCEAILKPLILQKNAISVAVAEEATEIYYLLWEATDFAYLRLLMSVASKLIPRMYLILTMIS